MGMHWWFTVFKQHENKGGELFSSFLGQISSVSSDINYILIMTAWVIYLKCKQFCLPCRPWTWIVCLRRDGVYHCLLNRPFREGYTRPFKLGLDLQGLSWPLWKNNSLGRCVWEGGLKGKAAFVPCTSFSIFISIHNDMSYKFNILKTYLKISVCMRARVCVCVCVCIHTVHTCIDAYMYIYIF